ncbi:hypothetical protein ACRARG_03360 [Pseudooceanicola sp. C21-150M6]|uniref:hypothetical protein n=1 Tax=Pseudooceanicola sp. C21-150M6 TaxID=3434355 RepID=UPI003D7F2D13
MRTRVALPMVLLAGPAFGLELPPLCHQTAESGMEIILSNTLGDDMASGIMVEDYMDARDWRGRNDVPPVRAPMKKLEGFDGIRIVHCASGRFMAAPDQRGDYAAPALAATEFLRPKLKAGKAPTFADVRNAVKALYPGAMEFRETAETCGCNAMFPGLRPAELTPFEERTDVDH